MKKFICLIQARMGSTRLPGKVMKYILDKPMIYYVVERVKQCKYIDQVVVVTTETLEDDDLVDYLITNEVNVYRGDTEDVLKRYLDAAQKYHGDIIVRITGDCPLIDPVLIDHIISYYLIMGDFDYVHIDTNNDEFLHGIDVEVFTQSSLSRTMKEINSIENSAVYREHVTPYIRKHPEKFKIGVISGLDIYKRNYRLCVDTKEDFEVVRIIYNLFQDPYVSTSSVIKYLDKHPELVAINSEVQQILV